MAVVLAEDEERAINACRQVLGETWKKGSVGVKVVSGGYCNKLLLCSLDEKSIDLNNNKPKESKVLLRFMGGKNMFQILGEAGEALVFYMFAENGLGPKLLAAFSETRVEQFVQSRPLSVKDYDNPELYAAMARKLAHIHSLDVPIKRDPSVLFEHFEKLVSPMDGNVPDLKGLGQKEQQLAKKIFSVDFRADLKWIRDMVPKFKTRVVFCHNDYHHLNVLLRTDCDPNEGYDERLIVVDMEMCSYFYRGLDLGAHFQTANFSFADSGDPMYIGPVSEERKRFFIREYLKEWISRNPEAYDPELDTEDNVLLESDFFALLRGMVGIIFTFDGIVNGNPVIPLSCLMELSLIQLKDNLDYKSNFQLEG